MPLMQELPPPMQRVCSCYDPSRNTLRKAAVCFDCNGYIYPRHPNLDDATASIAQLQLVGAISSSETPVWTAANVGYREDPISRCQFSRKLRPKRLRLGIEVELLGNTAEPVRAAHRFTQLFSLLNCAYRTEEHREADHYCIMKHDGSLPGPAAEMSCIPATLETHDRVWRMVSGVLSQLSTGTVCGLHVHIDRRDLTPLDIGKVHCFWNKVPNSVACRDFMGRGFTNYAQQADDRVHCLPRQVQRRHLRHLRGQRRRLPDSYRTRRGGVAGRHNAVAHRAKTIEIRIARASRDPLRLINRIAAIEASLRFLKYYSIHELVGREPHDLWQDFDKWCSTSTDLFYKGVSTCPRF